MNFDIISCMKKKYIYYLAILISFIITIWGGLKLTESSINLTPLHVTVSQLASSKFYLRKLVQITGTANFELCVGASLTSKTNELRNIFILQDKTSEDGLIVKFIPDEKEKERLNKGRELAQEYVKSVMELQRKVNEYNNKIQKHNETMAEPQKKINAYQQDLKEYKEKVDTFNIKIKEHNTKLETLQKMVSNYYFRLGIFSRNASKMTPVKKEIEKKNLTTKKQEIEDFAKTMEQNKNKLTELKTDIANREKILASKKTGIDKYMKVVMDIKAQLAKDKGKVEEYQAQIMNEEKKLKELLNEKNKTITGMLVDPPSELFEYLTKKGAKLVKKFAIQRDGKVFPLVIGIVTTFFGLLIFGIAIYLVIKFNKISATHNTQGIL